MREEEIIDLLHHPGLELTRYYLAEALSKYFRLKVRGVRRVPRSGPAIILPNHSGFAGFDAMMIFHTLRKDAKRSYKALAHRAYFDLFHSLRAISRAVGFTEAHITNARKVLDDGEVLVIFPEGESGNFKSSLQRYQLQPFHTGFLRLALTTGAPIIPCLVVGAEETNFNLGNINLSRFIDHVVIPMPLNLLPLPAKWSIEFLPPIQLGKVTPAQAKDHAWIQLKTLEIQAYMQKELAKRSRARQSIY